MKVSNIWTPHVKHEGWNQEHGSDIILNTIHAAFCGCLPFTTGRLCLSIVMVQRASCPNGECHVEAMRGEICPSV
jgi:hypothetical protein